MFDFHEKRKIRSVLYSKPVIFVLFSIAGLLSISVYNRYVVALEMEEKLDQRQAEYESLKDRADLLEEKVKYLTDERGVEEELRNRFDVAKEGEQVVILVDKKESVETATTTEVGSAASVVQATEEDSLLKRLFKFW